MELLCVHITASDLWSRKATGEAGPRPVKPARTYETGLRPVKPANDMWSWPATCEAGRDRTFQYRCQHTRHLVLSSHIWVVAKSELYKLGRVGFGAWYDQTRDHGALRSLNGGSWRRPRVNASPTLVPPVLVDRCTHPAWAVLHRPRITDLLITAIDAPNMLFIY